MCHARCVCNTHTYLSSASMPQLDDSKATSPKCLKMAATISDVTSKPSTTGATRDRVRLPPFVASVPSAVT